MTTIPRDVFSELSAELDNPEVIVLLGPRQVGKTTLLHSLNDYVQELGYNTLFFDLEQPHDLHALSGDEDEVIQRLTCEADFVFIDEFYYLKNAGHLFKAIYDRCSFTDEKVKIIVSGSSSVEIHRHLQDGQSLAGRHLVFRIFPLNFKELTKSGASGDVLSQYLTFGGMPGIALDDSDARRQQLLQHYVAAYLYADVKGLVPSASLQDFTKTLYAIAADQGVILDSSMLAERLQIDEDLIKLFISVMVQTNTLYAVPSYRPNRVTDLKDYRKYYLYDLGIRNSILRDFRAPDVRQDKKSVYESFVVLSLVPRLQPNMDLRFWRVSKGEQVDFVLSVNREPTPIVVDLALQVPKAREGFEAFLKDCPNTKRIITVTREGFDSISSAGIVHDFISVDEVSSILPGSPATTVSEKIPLGTADQRVGAKAR